MKRFTTLLVTMPLASAMSVAVAGQVIIDMPPPPAATSRPASTYEDEFIGEAATTVGDVALARFSYARYGPRNVYGGGNGFPLGRYGIGYYPSGYNGPRAVVHSYGGYGYGGYGYGGYGGYGFGVPWGYFGWPYSYPGFGYRGFGFRGFGFRGGYWW